MHLLVSYFPKSTHVTTEHPPSPLRQNALPCYILLSALKIVYRLSSIVYCPLPPVPLLSLYININTMQ